MDELIHSKRGFFFKFLLFPILYIYNCEPQGADKKLFRRWLKMIRKTFLKGGTTMGFCSGERYQS